jgi:MFS family permease
MIKKLREFNRVVVLLTLTDMFTWGPLIIISALAGIYLGKKLGTNVVDIVGIGTAIYFLTRAIFQLPLGHITDKIEKDTDEIIILALGVILMGLPFMFYPNITQPYHYYILQFIFGLGVSLNVTNWRKLFATNVDQGKEGKQYAFYETLMSLSTAILSTLVGVIANLGDRYFDWVMRGSSIIVMLSCIYVASIYFVTHRKSKNVNQI